MRDTPPVAAPRATILVIDDDPDMRGMLQEALVDAGYHILLASDGRQGLQLCCTHDVQLIITDLVMPGQEGMETIRAARRQFPALPIIAMTGSVSRDPSKQLATLGMAAALGASETFLKPLSLKELLTAIRRLVSRVS
jgi:CheY-like chemotaxis protein